MYLVMVIGLMLVVPAISVVVEYLVAGGGVDVLALIGKWFVFWGIGVRLFIAGVSQIFRPQFTTENILGEKNAGATLVVQELGFANVAFGTLGIVGPWLGWTPAAALAGAVFLGLAGIRHIVKTGKGTKETIATLTDLLLAAILVVFLVSRLLVG